MIVLRIIWSLIAWPIAIVWMAALFLLALPFLPFVSFQVIQKRGFAQLFGLVPYVTLSRMSTQHHPDFRPDETSVFVQNHSSVLDAHVALATIPTVVCGLQNEAHLRVPIYGWLMSLARGIPVPANREGRLAAITEIAKSRAAENISILVFPEGHRTRDGRVRRYRTGGLIMARDAGLPIVPLCVRGMYEVLPRRQWIIRPGHIEVYFGPQIETTGLGDEQMAMLAEKLTAYAQTWVDGREPDPIRLGPA
jgi:1-acyl-sn-glycerol-3-phosphate acyltransferase